jgi:hypothetical protein
MRKETTIILIMLLTGCNNLVSNPVIKESNKPVEVKESVKPSVLPSAKPSIVSNTEGQAQVVNNNQNSNSQNVATVIVPTPKPIPTVTPNVPNNSTNLTGNVIPNPTPTPTIVPEIELIRVDKPNGEVAFYKPTNKTYPYTVWYPIPDNPIKNLIIFYVVSEYKIKYNKEKKEFYSLLNIDVSEINNLFKNYKLEVFPMIEEKDYALFEKIEKDIRLENPNTDYIGSLNQYTLEVEDKTRVKELILKMRESKFFRFIDIARTGVTT